MKAHNITYYRLFLYIISFFCLLSGGLIYLLFREQTLLMFSWAAIMKVDIPLKELRGILSNCKLPDIILYSLPDGFWTLSYISLMEAFWFPVKQRILWAALIPIIGCVSEILQYFKVMPGTYDIWDLFCYLIPFLIYSFLYKKYTYEFS